MPTIEEMKESLKQVSDEGILQGIDNARDELESMTDALKMVVDEAGRRGLEVPVTIEDHPITVEMGNLSTNGFGMLSPVLINVLKLAASVYVQHINNLKEGTTSWMKENITPEEHEFLMRVYERADG